MRGNSGFIWRWLIIRHLNDTTSKSLNLFSSLLFSSKQQINIKMYTILFVIFTSVMISSTYAGPVNIRHRRMMREIDRDLVIDLKNNNSQPDDGKCLMDGQQVSQSSVLCEKKNGCRAIQKTGYCCPDYQCECERDGKMYKNGEKLIDPETPCTVCYCQGGEILCNSVTCYKRNDCVPKIIQGRCCPEYDSCPPLDEVLSSTAKPNSNQNKLVPSLGIKIKEITKAEEIRIVDEKPKIIYPTIKPNGNTGSNQSKTSSIETMSSTTEISSSEVGTGNILVTSSEKNPNSEINSSNETLTMDKNIEQNSSIASETRHDEVVIVDRNGESKPIIVLGVEGLQRGDIVEDPALVDGKFQKVEDSNFNRQHSPEVTDSDLEPEAAGSEINFHVSKAKPETINKITTEGVFEEVVSSSTPREIFETILYTSGPEISDEKISTKTAFETIYYEPNELSSSVSTENPSSPSVSHDVHHSPLDDDDTHVESNPAYPTIPDDDLSIYGREVLTQTENDDYLENSHKSKSGLQVDESKSFSEKLTTEGPGVSSSIPLTEPSKFQSSSTENSMVSEIYNVSPQHGQERAPGEPFLVPEWERNSTETTNHNETADSSEDEWKDIAIDIDPGSGSGSGSGSGGGQIIEETSSISSTVDHARSSTVNIFDDTTDETPENTSDNIQFENRAFSSNIYDSENQLSSMKLQKVIKTFNNFRKSYLNVF